MTIYHLDAILALFFLWRFLTDRFRSLNRFGSALKRRTGFLDWGDSLGDMESWIQHGMVCASVASAWGALSWVCGLGFRAGFAHGAAIMLVVYVVRELVQGLGHARNSGPHGPFVDRRRRLPWQKGIRVGWLIDGVLDLAGPLLAAWLSR